MASEAPVNRPKLKQAGEVGPDIYARWRTSTLGAITESLEQQLIFEMTGPLSGKSVLDVGCGDGTLAAEFRRRGASLVAGCDRDPRMIAKAAARPAGQVDPRYLLACAEHLPFRDRFFDVVTAITVVCFIEEKARAVREMARVLKPGGIVVVAGLGQWSTWAARRRIRAWLGDEFWQAARFATAHELRALATGAGLRVKRISGAVYFPPLGAAARVMRPIDSMLGKTTTFGAAFIAMQATK